MKTTVTLSDGREMPRLGLGTWPATPDQAEKALIWAIDAGYRHVDTAYSYFNEEGVGAAIKHAVEAGKVTREELFVVTKLPGIAMKAEKVEKYLRLSLKKLGLDFVDLFLIHLPVGWHEVDERTMYPQDADGNPLLDYSTDLIAVWKAMEKMVELGLTKSIGISNFNIKQVRKIAANAKIMPAVNQVECHLYYQQRDLREECNKYNVVTTSFGTLGSPGRAAAGIADGTIDLLHDPVVLLIANKHRRTAAQVLLRFFIQENIIVIPKSVNEDRIKQNGDVFSFELDDLDMAALRSQDKGEAGQSFIFSESIPGWSDHPEQAFR